MKKSYYLPHETKKKLVKLRLKKINKSHSVVTLINKKIKLRKNSVVYNHLTNRISISYYYLLILSDIEIDYILFHEYGHSLYRLKYLGKRKPEYEAQVDYIALKYCPISLEQWKRLMSKISVRYSQSPIEYTYRKKHSQKHYAKSDSSYPAIFSDFT